MNLFAGLATVTKFRTSLLSFGCSILCYEFPLPFIVCLDTEREKEDYIVDANLFLFLMTMIGQGELGNLMFRIRGSLVIS